MDLINSGSIADDWGLPSNLDAIFQFSGDGRIYAIKDSQYYTINSITRKRPSGPPRPLRDFGVYRVNAAFMATNGRNMRDTIFFEGNRYYKIDDRTRRVSKSHMMFQCFSDYTLLPKGNMNVHIQLGLT